MKGPTASLKERAEDVAQAVASEWGAQDSGDTAAQWENMFKGLKVSLPSNQLHKLEPYQRCGRTVARFSFTL